MVIPLGHIPCHHTLCVIFHVTIFVNFLVIPCVHIFVSHIVNIFTQILCIFCTIFLVDFPSHILGHIFVGLLFIPIVTSTLLIFVIFLKA